jgi:Mn2+/Fe2+ NRAMP family transporter
MGEVTGSAGKWIFLIGFWGAVFSSMIGVWHGIPYLFADFVQLKFKRGNLEQSKLAQSKFYKFYLIYLALPPIILLFMGKPVWIVILYAVAGAFFMPFLAMTLIYLNSKLRWLKEYKNSITTKIILIFSLIIFAYLMLNELLKYF